MTSFRRNPGNGNLSINIKTQENHQIKKQTTNRDLKLSNNK